ncbi:uncharacterized protein LOC129598152 [Paramacrobiotus metropolitanus]|uniref:uncharacterized protein LOC129598152 n=1 Tax=Paramacrobiotus metropolitanus TaxID=2943436 RepID=UPI002445DD6F|nr:uncharacterized protein LOC129598152 [Paramacrobiotus metropolitanus]
MFENSQVWPYGAVDVRDGDGSFRHGLVIALIPEKGFLVDFGYRSHEAEFVSFSRCFGNEYNPLACKKAVEILWRGSKKDAWRWYPATIVAGSLYTFTMVEMYRKGKLVREVVRKWDLQRAEDRPLLDLNRYRLHSVKLNLPLKILAQKRSREDFRWWNRIYGRSANVILQNVEHGRLFYISSRSKEYFSPSDFWKLAKVFRRMATRSAPRQMLSRFPHCISENVPVDTGRRFIDRKFLLNFCQRGQKSGNLEAHLPCIDKVLPVELIGRIFSFLELRTRVKCRLVCKSWLNVLTFAPACAVVQIDLLLYYNDELSRALDRNITATTKKLILFSTAQDSNASDPLTTVIGLLKLKGIRIHTICIAHFDVWTNDVLAFSSELNLKVRSEWSDVCDRLVLDDVRVYGLAYLDEEGCRCLRDKGMGDGSYDMRFDYLDFKATIKVNSWKIHTNDAGEMGSALEVLENACLPMSDEDCRALQTAMDAKGLPQHTAIQVLKQWQAGDARVDRISPLTNIPLADPPLNSLRKLTLFALQWHLLPRKPRDMDSWETGKGPWHLYWKFLFEY